MTYLLFLAAAVISIAGLLTGSDTWSEVGWHVWGAALIVASLGALRPRRYATREALDAGAEAGDPRALRSLGAFAKLSGDRDEAERLLRRGADLDDPECLWDLARLIEERDGLPDAEPYFRRAAERGHLVAGRFFRRGGVYNREGTAAPVTVVSRPTIPSLHGLSPAGFAGLALIAQVVAAIRLISVGEPWSLIAVLTFVTCWSLGRFRDFGGPGRLPVTLLTLAPLVSAAVAVAVFR